MSRWRDSLIIFLLAINLTGCMWNNTVGKAFPCLKDIPYEGYEADWWASEIRRNYSLGFRCGDRVEILKERMLKNSMNFAVVYGLYLNEPHIWIEKDGKIIDPSVLLDCPEWYEESKREEY